MKNHVAYPEKTTVVHWASPVHKQDLSLVEPLKGKQTS